MNIREKRLLKWTKKDSEKSGVTPDTVSGATSDLF